MSNLPALANSLTIQTVDGQTIDLANFNPLDVVTPSSSGKPLYRVAAAQTNDARLIGFSEAELRAAIGKLFLTRKIKVDNVRQPENIGPFEGDITVFPLGVWANRSYMPKYERNAAPEANRPLCHSENFITPDPRFVGKFSNQCCAFDRASNRVVPVCPLAKWGEKNPTTGKSTPPACSESYILFAAITLETEEGRQVEVVEIYLQGKSATNGKNLTAKLNAMQKQGVEIFRYPINVFAKSADVGFAVDAAFAGKPAELSEEDVQGMLALTERVKDAIAYRQDMAARMPENEGEEIPFDTVPAQPAQTSKQTQPSQSGQATQPVPPKAAAPTNGNGTKKKSLI